MEVHDLPQLVVLAQYTLSSLRMAIETDGAQEKCWVLVEGKADYDYYRKVIIGNDALVTQAGYVNKNGEIKGGFRPVNDIVDAILKDGNTDGIIGIVDVDYITFMNPPKSLPTNIFCTDKRDLEMSLWSIPEISTEMYNWLSSEPALQNRKLTKEKLNKCQEICGYMGSIHISDAWHGNKCKHEFKNSQYWDSITYTFLSDWQNNLFSYYQQECAKMGIVYGQDQLDESNAYFNVHSLDFCTIARGHDFLSILSNAMIDTAKYNEVTLVNMMISLSTVDHFRRTILWHSINDWQNANGYVVVI